MSSRIGSRHRPKVGLAATLLLLATILVAVPMSPGLAQVGPTPPSFSKVFSPDTIGPGSTTTLTFTIGNGANTAIADDLVFSDPLPAGVVIATPANANTTCDPETGGSGPTVTAPPGGSTIALGDAAVGAGETCTVTVDVTSSTVGTHMNVSGDLTSSFGNSGTATDDLMVAATLPGFSKDFAPDPINLGERSTLTFTIDNTATGATAKSNLDFTDTLPSGLVIADPSNASTTCGTSTIPATLTATAGTSVITLDANGTAGFPAVAANATCTVTVDVTATAGGTLLNESGGLQADFTEAGKATATIDVGVSSLHLRKSFTDDPTAPGGTANLEFRIDNFDRDNTATGVTFSDDLGSVLAGLAPSGALPSQPCSTASSLEFAEGTLTLTGGTVAPQDFCTFSVPLSVPAGATPGNYVNTTGAVSATVGGSPTTGNMATETLHVSPAPVLIKEFTDDPVGAGDSVTLEFTITNTYSESSLTDIQFTDELTTFLPSPISVASPTLPASVCGGTLSIVALGVGGQGLQLTGGSLNAAGSAGDSCTFSVSLTIPAGFAGGTYTNTTSEITGRIDTCGDGCFEPVTGKPASDNLVVVGAPKLRKEFTDDPVVPGGTVTLQFTLTHPVPAPQPGDPAVPDITAIAFTDDLDAALSGLLAIGLPAPVCGGTASTPDGGMTIDFSGGILTAGEVCSFDVTLNVPASAGTGSYTNTTSTVTATSDGVAVTGPAANDTLKVSELVFTKEFTDDPVIPGGTGNLRFTIENKSTTTGASITSFTDDLDANLSGLAANGAPTTDTCGGTASLLSGNTLLLYSGGTVPANSSCIIDLPIMVPAGAANDGYGNTTSSLFTSFGTVDPAVDTLVVDGERLQLTKSFTDDPVSPGGTVTLEFTLTNLDTSNGANAITFTDDLNAALSGLEAVGLPASDVCGAGSTLSGTSILTLSSGNLDPGVSCTFSVTLQVPAAAAAGTYVNSTSDVTGTITGLPVTGSPAADDLQVITVTFTKSFADPIVAGTTGTLTFTITNGDTNNALTGLAFSDNLNDVLPGLVATGLPANGICGAGSQIAGTSNLTFTGGNLPAGGSCTFDVTVSVPANILADDYTNTTSNLTASGLFVAGPATDLLTVTNEADISVTKTDGVTSAVPGQDSVVYTIVVTNNGPSDDPSVTVADTFPAELSCGWTSVAAGGATGNTSNAGPANLADTLSMPAGSSVTYTVTCTIDQTATGTLSNTVTATASVTDLTSGNNSATDSDTVLTPTADISVTKTDAVTSATPGIVGGLTYLIVVTNSGPSHDPSVSVTDTFPADLTCTFTSQAFHGATGNTASGSGDLSETLSMPDESSVAYTVNCTIDSGATGTLSNTVTATASVTDPTPGNNSATDNDTVLTPSANIIVTKGGGVIGGPLMPVPGRDTITYFIAVSNDGPSDDPSVSMTDTFPADLTCAFTSSADGGATGNTASGSGNLSEALSMPNASSVSYTAECTIDPSATGTLSNTATATGSFDPNTDNNTDTDDLVLSPQADLSITKSDDVDPVVAGNNVVYTVTVSNAGPSDAQNVVVTDTLPAGMSYVSDTDSCVQGPPGTLTCPIGAIAAGGSISFDITTNVATGTPSGTLTNSATVSSSTADPEDANDSTTEDTTVQGVSIVLEKATNGVDADAAEDAPEITIGQPVAWTYVVTNTGVVELFGVSVTDDILGAIACPSDRLGPGISMTCTASGLADGPGLYANLGTATGLPAAGAPVTDTDPSHYEGVLIVGGAGVDIRKTPDTQNIPVNGTANFTISVQNLSDTFSVDVSVEDPLAPNCDRAIGALGTLTPGQKVMYTCSLAGVEGDFVNVATAKAFIDDVEVATDSDSAEVTVEAPSISIEKTPDSQSILPGGTATWNIRVTNTGRLPLTGVAVTDPAAPDCARPIPDLPAGASHNYTCMLDGITEDLTNVATATGSDGENTAMDSDSADVVVLTSGLDIDKTPDVQTIDPGDTANFTITVRNTGGTTLENVQVSDPAAPNCDKDIGSMGPGAVFTYSCSLDNVTQPFTNIATASADSPTDEALTVDDDAQVNVRGGAIEILKLPNSQLIASGGTAEFTIVVTNNGRGDLTNVVVEDVQVPACNNAFATLAEGATVEYTCSVANVTDSFVNVITATASDVGEPVTDSDDAAVAVAEDLTIVKSPDTQVVVAGSDATFSISVFNSGDVAITGVAVADPLAPNCDNSSIGTLNPDDVFTYTCTAPGVTTGFTNEATVTGMVGATALEDKDTAVVDVADPSIAITKLPASQVVVEGGTAMWQITVTNNSRVDLTGVAVTDAEAPGCAMTIGDLGAGATSTYSCSLAGVTANFTNVAEVEGTAGAQTVNDSASADVVVVSPALEITKTPDTQTIDSGDTANFTITVTNTGTTTINGITVEDPLAPDCNNDIGTLGPGDFTSYDCSLADVTAGFTNVATVSVDPGTGELEFFDEDNAEVIVRADVLDIQKTPDTQFVDPGGTAQFTIVVTNTGRDELTGVAVSDPNAPDCNRPSIGTLAPSGTVNYTCQVTGVTTAFVNTATATGTHPTLGAVTASDDAEVFVAGADISITKTPAEQFVSAGETASWTITVTNSGDEDLTGVAVSDPAAPNCNNSIGDLGVEDFVSYTCDLANVTADLTNVATVTGTAPSGGVMATAQADVLIRADLFVNKSDFVTSAVPGQDIVEYEILIGNSGPSDDPAATLTDTFPAGLTCTWISIASGGATGNTASGSGNINETLSLPVGSDVLYSVDCTIDPGATGTLSNTATATSSVIDPDPADNSATDADTVLTPQADISVTKTDGVTSAIPGQSLTYTIVVTNNGPSNDPSVTVADTFPAALTCTYTSVASGGASGNTAAGSGDISDTLAMPVGASVTYTVDCTIDPGATGTLSNTASATSSVTDPDSGNNSATDGDTVLTPQADVAITKTDGVTSAIPGQSFTYTIVVTNNGPSDDPSVTVNDAFPAELNCSWTSVAAGGATGNTSSSGSVLFDTLAMPAGSSVTYTVTCTIDSAATGTLSNTATATGSVTDPDSGNNSATDSDTVLTPRADISITKTDGVTSAIPGEDNVVYTIVVTNNGPSDDPSVAVNDAFPAELNCSWTSVAAGGATGNSSSSGSVLADTLSMPAGSSVTYTVTCSINSAATGTLSNTAAATGSVTDPATNNNSATDNDTVLTPQADITVVSKSDGVTSATPGGSVVYFIHVENNGPSTDPAVEVVDNFPLELSCTWTTSTSGGAVSTKVSDFGDISDTVFMPPGSVILYTAPCGIWPDSTGTLANTASAEASVMDPNDANNSATDDDTVLTPIADISITKTDGVSSAVPGQSLTYTIVVTNHGLSNDPSVTVVDTFPTVLTCSWTSVSTDGGFGAATGNTSASGNLSDTLAMPAGSSVTYTVTCTIDPGATGTLSNTATATSSVTDPDSGDNSATDNDTVLTPQADISVTKTDGVTSAVPGQSLTYTIVVANNGPSDDPAVAVADTFPLPLTCSWTSVAAGGATGNTSGSGNLIDTLAMPAGSSVTYTVSCAIDTGATGTLSNTATATGSVTDPTPGNNSATDNDTVLDPQADLSITKSDRPDPIVGGELLIYTVAVTNNGPSDATNVEVTDTLPPEVTFVSDTDSCVEAPAGTLTCDLGTIPAGGATSFTITVQVTAGTSDNGVANPFSGVITNNAEVASDATDANPNDNVANIDTVVQARPTCNGLFATHYGTPGDDLIRGTDGDDVIVGLRGNDRLIGMRGNDTICGGADDDTINGNDGNDTIFGEHGDDDLRGNDGDDTIDGGFGADEIRGGDDNDNLDGGGGPDELIGGSGDDTMLGGTGGDYLDGGSHVTGDDLDGGTGPDTCIFGETVVNCEFPLPAPVADISIDKDDGVISAVPGRTVTYTIIVRNAGPSTDSAVSVRDRFQSPF